ncbi:MAG: undecaprenyl-diphosphate phosphatase [Acidimicrobiales bacterium]
MSFFQAIIYGIVQGLTEFLPISSSAHLRIVPAILGWDDPGAGFTAVIQLGTMAAVVLYFWKDLWRVTLAWCKDVPRAVRATTHRGDASIPRAGDDARMGWYLIVATIPIAVFGLAFKDQIETGARDLRIIAFTMIVGGLVMLWADRTGKRTKTLEHIQTRDGVAVGLAQSLALVPGVSRSGSTISAGLFLGFDRESAARFSFLLSIPAVVLSGLFELKDVTGCAGIGVGPTVVATVVSFVVGYAAIWWLLSWLAGHSTLVFTVYRCIVGVLLVVLIAAGTVEASQPPTVCTPKDAPASSSTSP